MPTEAYYVTNVCRVPTRQPGLMQYQIYLQAIAPDVPDTIVTTVNNWRAALCQRALETHARVVIGSRETKYGYEAITVVLDEEGVTHASVSR